MRSQHVAYKKSISGKESISMGVPQRSILGLFLFLIQINVLQNVIKNGQVMMYADDTTLFLSGSNLEN